MIPNPHKFMVTAIDMFYRQSKIANKPSDPYTLGFDPSRFYTNGHCAEFAYVLADFAAKKGLDPSMTIMFRNRINAKSGEAIEKILSHCIVEMDGQAYDICGDDARMTWFIKSGYMNQDNNEERSEWEFVSIPIADREDAFKQLQEHCTRHNVPFSRDQVEKDQAIFNSLTDKSKTKDCALGL
ncbi:hypothetical protein JL827_25910 [Vibrio parahaemolyticus]|nr:hypothetical protein [Vibrio parahaemolyticus]